MSFARLHKAVAFLIAGLGLAALAIGPELDWTSELVIAALFVLALFAEGERIRDPRWIRAWNVGLLALVAVQVLRGFAGAAILPLALEVTAALQISRLMNRRGAREHQQIAALALLHLIAATVLSTELAYAFAFLGFVIVLPWMLAISHLRAEIEGQLGARPKADRERDLARVLGSKRVIGPSFLAGTAALAVPLFAMTGLVFVLFPRVGLGFLSFGRDESQRISGFGANVALGDFGVIRTDPTVVLRVTPPDMSASPPPLRALRMRGTSFERYDGRRWTRSPTLYSTGVGRMDSYYPAPRRMPDPARDQPWGVVLDALDEPVIFTPPSTVGLEIAPNVTGGVEVGRDIHHIPGVEVRYGDADGLGLRYTAWTSRDPADRDVAEALDPEEARRYLQVPEGHAAVAELARQWTEGASTDEERVRMIAARLRDSGEYAYSLEMPRVGARTPLEVFLLEAKQGHCEYFSTALAIQLRTLGIPTRNVTGFLGGQLNRYGGYYAISQGDAHSWVEVFLPGRGWVAVDPTPPSRDELAPDTGLLPWLRDLVDAARTRWSEHVVGYDLRSQVSLYRDVRRFFRELGGDERPARGASGAGARAPPWLWAALGVAAALALVILRLRRRPKAEPPVDAGAREAVRLYRALDAALAKLGHARPAGRTPLEHVAALEEAGFGALELAREVTERYLGARYGGRAIDPPELERLTREVAALRRRRPLSVGAR